MLQRTLTIQNKLGLHARPSALLSKTAALFKSSITLTENQRSVDAKSILGLMTMALPCGTELTVTVDGPDEASAMESIVELFEDRFGEEE
ncbi:HPr family phosphocarrier protein [Sutterella sp.]|uniref:HPr family phosphocarrier protein n=1 Tax=Sutterella sp. TaxID=1981025 RepID=UPI0026DF159D|nr:HPr family phosphocarrier protein [Sutterella sp.]MDO5530401.1 HPr family phosphocarrier protein [Sutterella sp.]